MHFCRSPSIYSQHSDIIMAHHENVLDQVYDLSGVKDTDHLTVRFILGAKLENEYSQGASFSSQTTPADLQHTSTMSYYRRWAL